MMHPESRPSRLHNDPSPDDAPTQRPTIMTHIKTHQPDLILMMHPQKDLASS